MSVSNAVSEAMSFLRESDCFANAWSVPLSLMPEYLGRSKRHIRELLAENKRLRARNAELTRQMRDQKPCLAKCTKRKAAR